MCFDLFKKQETFSGAMETDMKGNGRMTRGMVKGKCSIHWGLLLNKALGRMITS